MHLQRWCIHVTSRRSISSVEAAAASGVLELILAMIISREFKGAGISCPFFLLDVSGSAELSAVAINLFSFVQFFGEYITRPPKKNMIEAENNSLNIHLERQSRSMTALLTCRHVTLP